MMFMAPNGFCMFNNENRLWRFQRFESKYVHSLLKLCREK